MTIYIAGKMTGLPEHNRPAFNKKADELREQGFRVLNPASIGDLPYEMYWPINKAMIDGADAIYMLDGWEDSKGARKELFYAIKHLLFIMAESSAPLSSLLGYREHSIAISNLTDCNTCSSKKDCPHAPKLGEMTRINCYLWKGNDYEL